MSIRVRLLLLTLVPVLVEAITVPGEAVAAEREPVTIEIEEHAPLVGAASRAEDPLAPQVDLFGAMGAEADRLTPPAGEAPTTLELDRVAERAAAAFEAAREAELQREAGHGMIRGLELTTGQKGRHTASSTDETMTAFGVEGCTRSRRKFSELASPSATVTVVPSW